MGGKNEQVVAGRPRAAAPSDEVIAGRDPAAAEGSPSAPSPARQMLLSGSVAALGVEPPAGPGEAALRLHINSGQMHFHDDKSGLKAAVPMADWWTATQKLLQLQRFVWVDAVNGTLLIVTSYIGDDGAGGDLAKIVLSLTPCKASEQFVQTTTIKTEGT